MASMRLPTPAAERSSSSAAAARPAERQHEGHTGLTADDEEAQANSSHSTTERTALLDKLAELHGREERYYKLKPCESIYSFYMFMPAVEYRATGRRCNYILGFALGLVILNIVMQGILMFVVSRDSIQREDVIHERLIHSPPAWYQFHKLPVFAGKSGAGAAACVPENSLCVHVGDKISCAPRSIALLQHWDQLDVNGDGVWSRNEVENQAHRADVHCRFGSDPLAMYETMVNNLKGQPALDGRLHPNLVEGSAIHKAYFDWYLGEPLLCGHIDEDFCGNLFTQGVFDQAIRGGAPFKPEINDLQSARAYCSDLLQSKCEHILPSSYHTWKLDALDMCGAKTFAAVPYDSPDKDPNNSMTEVTYHTPGEYQKHRSWIFTGYLGILLLTFFSTLLAEWKDIYRTTLYCIQFPHLRGGANDRFQRWSVILVTLLRVVLWALIGYGGTLFLTSKTDYLGMIFDALSLAFIITIDELIYATMLRSPMKSAHQELEALLLHRRALPLSVHALEGLMLILIGVMAVVVACSYQNQELRPISQALDCLCSGEGSTCHEASVYTKVWWNSYWAQVVPGASRQIDRLLATV